MDDGSQRKAGVILSYVNLIIGCVVPLLYTPIMLRLMGQAEYGLYSLSNSVIGYLGLLNFGMGSVFIRYAARYRAENKVDDIRRLTGMFVVIYSIFAVLVCIVGAVIVIYADVFFQEGLSAEEVVRMRWLLIVMIANTAISFPASIIVSILTVYECFVFSKALGVVATILTPCLNLVVLYFGGASLGITLAGAGLQCLMNLLYMWFVFRKLRIIPSFHNMPLNLIKEIIQFSAFVFLSSIVDMLYWATDKVLIGATLGTVAVAVYNVGGVFTSMMQNMAHAISNVFTTRVTMLSVREDSEKVTSELLIRIGRLQFYVVSFILSGYIVFGQIFLRLWAGEGYEEAYYVGLLTMIPLAVPLIQNIAFTFCVAQNKHRFRAIVYAVIAVINMVLTYLILPYYGIIGAAACTAGAFLLGNGIIMNVYYSKVMNMDIAGFWRTIGRVAVVPIVLSVASHGIVNMALPYTSWISMIVEVIVFTSLFWVMTWFISMNSYERGLFTGLFKKALGVFKKNKT